MKQVTVIMRPAAAAADSNETAMVKHLVNV